MSEVISEISPITRLEANRLGLRTARQILDAFHNVDVTVEGVDITVVAERQHAPPWPTIEGLSESADGPWPAPVIARCTWASGSVDLQFTLSFWRTTDSYRHLVGLSVAVHSTQRALVWITIPLAFMDSDAPETVVRASVTPSRRKGQAVDPTYAAQYASRSVVQRAGLPFTTGYYVEAFRVRLTDGAVMPAPAVAFKRLCHLALCKLPFFALEAEGVIGRLPFQAADVVIDEPDVPDDVLPSGKRAGLWPLPGGVRQYKSTLDALLGDLALGELEIDAFYAILRERYDVNGETARKGYVMVLGALGLSAVSDGVIQLTDVGRSYLVKRDPSDLFDRLHESFVGMLELLVLASELGKLEGNDTRQRMCSLLNVDWTTANQVSFRRNWLLSLGMTERGDDGDDLTELGRTILEKYAAEAVVIRERVRRLVDEDAPGAEGAVPVPVPEAPTVSPGLDAPKVVARAEPSAWAADRVDLRADRVAPHAKDLSLPPSTIARAVAALSAGKHLLLVGPPGTGKTELAHAIADAARSEGYCAGAYVATASADWTTFDTIGGYALQKNGELKFREGALLRAIKQWEWLIVDELNRADVDRAFGELMTVLAGRSTDTSFELADGSTVRIGPDPTASHPMPKTFRVIATMNTWDKTSLFRLSYAVQRRFAIVHVGIPNDAAYAGLLRKHGAQVGHDSPLPAEATDALVRLFSTNGLLSLRPVGPAVAIDVIRYARRRSGDDGVSAGEALAEAVAMYVLPQLEGLEHDRALRCHAAAMETIGTVCNVQSRLELRERFVDLFPHVKLPAA